MNDNAKPPLQLTLKVSPKRCVSVYGLQRMPITLYAGQWLNLLSEESRSAIIQFIHDHKDELAWKDEGEKP